MSNWIFDEGHGGNDVGATYKGRHEKNDTLKLAKRVKEIMEFNGEKVTLTRGTDKTMELSARTRIENNGSYDYFVSFHRNAFSPEKAKGAETYSISTSGRGYELSKKIQAELVKYFVDRKCKTANYYVLKNTKCPAVLIEIGFIDNTGDNQTFDSKFEDIAQGIARACLKQVGKELKLPQNNNSCDDIHRVKVNGTQVGAYKNHDSVANVVKENLGNKIEIN